MPITGRFRQFFLFPASIVPPAIMSLSLFGLYRCFKCPILTRLDYFLYLWQNVLLYLNIYVQMSSRIEKLFMSWLKSGHSIISLWFCSRTDNWATSITYEGGAYRNIKCSSYSYSGVRPIFLILLLFIWQFQLFCKD